jgi:hypothetical protein
MRGTLLHWVYAPPSVPVNEAGTLREGGGGLLMVKMMEAPTGGSTASPLESLVG